MPLSPGTRLGPYELGAVIGAGGMGEVYQARDTRLARQVAIKILPESFAGDAARLQRFEQEAQTVGTLNHPNVLSVYDVGAQDGIHFIVTELLHGETLREKLRPGPLHPRRAIDYAIQIAQGLAAAHEQGLVHRDLKPENLFVTKDGRVKILDFGLAKQTVMPPDSDGPTVANVCTSAGMVLGTMGYMSPEQVRGKEADSRSDIFSFGTVFYEMLTGQRAFQRSSSVETMNAILKDEPGEMARTPGREISPALQHMVQRCLEKDPAQRFQSAKDLSFALEGISAGSSEARNMAAVPASRSWRLLAAGLLLVLLVAGGAFAALSGWRRRPQPEYEQITFQQGYVPAARFAPDGQTVIYSAAWGQPAIKLYSMRLGATESRELNLPPAELLSVAPTGELAIDLNGVTWNGKGGRLARAPMDGGAPRALLDDIGAADWAPGSGKLAVARFVPGKCQVEYPIGNPLYQTIGWISHLRFSPQGDAIAFLDHPILGDDRGSVVLLDLEGKQRRLTREWNGTQGLAWSPDGREIWFTATAGLDVDRPLWAVTRAGKQRMVLRVPGGLYLEDIAPDGRVLLRHDERRYEVTAVQVGGASRLLSWLEIMIAASVSPDGKFVVIGDETAAEYGVYLRKVDGSPPVQLGAGVAGAISPDGKWVTSIPVNDTSKVVLFPTGIGEARTVTAPKFHYRSANWTSDGRRLVVRGSQADGPLQVWAQDLSGGSPRPITPQGVDGLFLTINHRDYVCARDDSGAVRLYPVDGGPPRKVTGISGSELVLGGSPLSDAIYVSPDPESIPLHVLKVNTITGVRQPFVTVAPTDPAGVMVVFPPMITADEKQYVYTLVRDFSVLYVAKGLE